MRKTMGIALILAASCVAVPACGSGGGSDALVGEWSGSCGTTDQSGKTVGKEVDATLRFTPDGKYSQTILGPEGGQVDGTYAATGESLDLKAKGDSLAAQYTIKDDVLTTTTKDVSSGTPANSTCTLRRAAG